MYETFISILSLEIIMIKPCNVPSTHVHVQSYVPEISNGYCSVGRTSRIDGVKVQAHWAWERLVM